MADEYDFDLNTKETLDRLGFSQTKLSRLVNEGKLSRVPKNPGSHRGKGAGWLYSSQQIDEFIKVREPKGSTYKSPFKFKGHDGECFDAKCCEGKCQPEVVSKATVRAPARTATQNASKRPWWKIWG